MAEHYRLSAPGHCNIYTNTPREIDIVYSLPNKGVNEETGVVLLIPGFGATTESRVYQKMRDQFADQYNLIAVQCHYFGQEFMQLDVQEENIENFNDMSFMQSIDNITAVLTVVGILKEQNRDINYGKIIVLGQSHGSYLAYLCNAFAPKLFTLLIDNSSYLYPLYLLSDRILNTEDKQIRFHYIAADFPQEKEVFYLPSLYRKFNNVCRIVSYNGDQDLMVPAASKKKFCEQVANVEFNLITLDEVEGIVFKSNTHGLGADFLLLFEKVMSNVKFEQKRSIELPRVNIKTSEHLFTIDYSSGLLQFFALIL
ncbi:DUF2920 family protein [Paenibacillus marinisediminis]